MEVEQTRIIRISNSFLVNDAHTWQVVFSARRWRPPSLAAAWWYYRGADYSYDANGNLTRTEEWGVGQFQRDYTYDALNQLLTERRADLEDVDKGVWKRSYVYDPVGNRDMMAYEETNQPPVTTTYAYDAANRLASRDEGGTATNYFFDANGNMTSEEEEHDTNRNFTWNRDDRMVQVSNEFAAGAPVVSYVYDAMGRRIVRKKGAEWRMFYYDGLSVAAEKKSTNSGGAWVWDALYTLAPGVIGHVMAQSNWSGAAWVSTFLHYDHIGNVTLSTNASGQVVDAYDQDAFGNPLLGPANGLRLQTKELDADAGLYYFYQRWYLSAHGMFLSFDPLGIIEGDGFYRFVFNNPLKIFDPTGMKSLLFGSGYACWDSQCDKCQFVHKPEDKNVLDDFPPVPKPWPPNLPTPMPYLDGSNNCVKSDGVYIGDGLVHKIPDNCKCTLKCDINGDAYEFDCSCSRFWHTRPTIIPPPKGWPTPPPGF